MRGSASLILSLLAGISATVQGSHLPVRIYTTVGGLASNTVNRIVRDSRGFLWFCTREGCSASTDITSLLQDHQGRMVRRR